MTALSCENCRFSYVLCRKGQPYVVTSRTTGDPVVQHREHALIECRRYAPRGPVVFPEKFQKISSWPSVSEDCWCGEHEPKGEVKP